MDAFLDDISLGLDSGVLSCPDMITKMESIAQTWEHLLSISGGSLNLKKCSWCVLYWEWLNGRPRIRPAGPSGPTIQLTQGYLLPTYLPTRHRPHYPVDTRLPTNPTPY